MSYTHARLWYPDNIANSIKFMRNIMLGETHPITFYKGVFFNYQTESSRMVKYLLVKIPGYKRKVSIFEAYKLGLRDSPFDYQN